MRPPDRVKYIIRSPYCGSCFDFINEKPSRRMGLKLHEKLVLRAARMRCEPTKAEAKLWERLREAPGWHTQEPLVFYIADFLHVPTSTIVELDGRHHHLPENEIKDATRTEELRSKGYTVIRFDNHQVMNSLESVLKKIAHAVEYRSTIKQVLPDRPRRGAGTHITAKKPPMHKKWSGRGYVRTKDKPDIMTVKIPRRGCW